MRQADEARGIVALKAGAPGTSERQVLIELRRKLRRAFALSYRTWAIWQAANALPA